MLTHDSCACLIQNGGEELVDDEDDNDQPPQERRQNQGVVIREINEDDQMENVDQNDNNAEMREAEEAQNGANQQENNEDVVSEEELSDIDPHHDALADYEPYEHYDMFSGERNDSELLNPIPIFENSCGDIPGSPSHSIYSQIHPLALMDSEGVVDPETAPVVDKGKRKREDLIIENETMGSLKVTVREKGEGSGSKASEPYLWRGAVGPEPSQAP